MVRDRLTRWRKDAGRKLAAGRHVQWEAAVVEIRWLTAFLDTPRQAPGAEQVAPFWQQVTGTRLSSRRGRHREFATLLPTDGDPFLRIQDLDAGVPGCHLDVHVDDVRAAADHAVSLLHAS